MAPEIVNMIKVLCAVQVCAVQTENGLLEWFPVDSSVRQGCLVYPMILAILRDFVLQACRFRGGIQISPELQLNDCDFDDDIALVAHCQEEIQHNLNELAVKSSPMGQKINVINEKYAKRSFGNHCSWDLIQKH